MAQDNHHRLKPLPVHRAEPVVHIRPPHVAFGVVPQIVDDRAGVGVRRVETGSPWKVDGEAVHGMKLGGHLALGVGPERHGLLGGALTVSQGAAEDRGVTEESFLVVLVFEEVCQELYVERAPLGAWCRCLHPP